MVSGEDASFYRGEGYVGEGPAYSLLPDRAYNVEATTFLRFSREETLTVTSEPISIYITRGMNTT